MGMFGTRIDFQLGEHLASEFVLWKHPPNRVSNNLLWFTIHPGLCRFRSKPRVTGIPSIRFLVQLVSGELELVAVGNDYEIARVDVGCVVRAMLAHQNYRDIRGDSANNLIFSIDDPPRPLEGVQLGVI